MSLYKKFPHLVPQILQDRADAMLKESNQSAAENIAQQLEVVGDFCKTMVDQYNKQKSAKLAAKLKVK